MPIGGPTCATSGSRTKFPCRSTRTCDLERLYADFERLHERLYGTKLEDEAEIVNIRVTVTGQVPRLKAPPFQPDEVRTAPIGER